MRFAITHCLVCLGLWSAPAGAFAQAKIGSVIQNEEMPALGGGKLPVLSNAPANVFIFLKPGQEHTRLALQHLAACEKELAGKPVRWVAIVSDRVPLDLVESEVKETGLQMPVLVDQGDAFYGKLGVVLTPAVGITDQEHRLVAYQPFTKVNFASGLLARVRHRLKEISDAELEQALKPVEMIQGGAAEVARRHLKLAEKHALAGNHQKALENAKKGLELDPNLGPAYTLLGKIHAAMGNRAEALKAFEKALQLDPKDTAAMEGLRRVSGHDSRAHRPEAWRRTQQPRLRRGAVQKVIEALEPHLEPEGTDDEEAPARNGYRYLSNRRNCLDYPGALALGLPIGSGRIESGHRQVLHARLKKAGAPPGCAITPTRWPSCESSGPTANGSLYGIKLTHFQSHPSGQWCRK